MRTPIFAGIEKIIRLHKYFMSCAHENARTLSAERGHASEYTEMPSVVLQWTAESGQECTKLPNMVRQRTVYTKMPNTVCLQRTAEHDPAYTEMGTKRILCIATVTYTILASRRSKYSSRTSLPDLVVFICRSQIWQSSFSHSTLRPLSRVR